jgi:hypothetical protein
VVKILAKPGRPRPRGDQDLRRLVLRNATGPSCRKWPVLTRMGSNRS